jgi:hypothetical protein
LFAFASVPASAAAGGGCPAAARSAYEQIDLAPGERQLFLIEEQIPVMALRYAGQQRGFLGRLIRGPVRPETEADMTFQDKSAIRDYTSGDDLSGDNSARYNEPLRRFLTAKDPAAELAAFLRSPDVGLVADLVDALRKVRVYEGVVQRGVALSPEALARYQPGAEVIEPTFLSTSTDPRAKQVATLPRTNGVIFVIKSKQGRAIARFSNWPSESEVLFQPFSHFRVKSRSIARRGDIAYTRIEMEEI